MLNLGNTYATVGLNHQEFDRGVQRVGSGVDTLLGHLGRIGDVVIGVTLAQSIQGLLDKLTEVPRKLISINAEMESIGLGMAAHLENASKLVAGTIEDAGAELAEATHKESLRLERVVQNMRDANEDLERRRNEVAQRRGVQAGETESATNRATSTYQERVADISRSQTRAAEDFRTTTGNSLQQLGRQLTDYNQRWSEGSQERSRVFNASLSDIGSRHSQVLGKLNADLVESQTQFQTKIADAASNAATRLDDINAKHSEAVQGTQEQITRSERNYEQDLIQRQSRISDQIGDISTKYSQAVKNVAADGERAAESFLDRVREIQYQASASLDNLRRGEAQATLRFQFGQRQLQRQLSRATTPDQRAELQERIQFQEADEALRRQGVEANRRSLEHRRQQELNAAQKIRDEAVRKGQERIDAETAQRNRRLAELQGQYARENAVAARSHQQRLQDLTRSLARENVQHERQTQAVHREQAQQVLAARRAHQDRLASFQRAIETENRAMADQTAKITADHAAREALSISQRDRQIAAAEDQYQRETDAAKRAYARITQDNAQRSERESENYAQHLDDINRRAQDTAQRIENDAADAERVATRRISDLTIQYQEAERAFQARYEDAAGDILARNSQLIGMFSEQWATGANEMLKAQDALTGGPEGGRRNWFSETTDIMERQRQVMSVLREESFRLPGTFQQIAKSAQQMMGFGLDPFEKGLYRIVSGLSLLPGAANVGTSGVIRAFGQLRAGASGQAERIFREIGVPLRQIPGLVFDAANKLVTDLPTAWRIVLDYFGPKTDVILKNYVGSWEVLTSNLQEIFENLMRIAGEPFYKGTKAFFETLYSDMTRYGPEIEKVAGQMGVSIGDFAINVYNFVKRLSDPAVTEPIGRVVRLLQQSGENMRTFIAQVAEAAGLASQGRGLLGFVEDLARTVEHISSALADPTIATSFGFFLRLLGETKDEAIRIIGEFVAGIAGASQDEVGSGLRELVQNLTVLLSRFKNFLVGVSSEDSRTAGQQVAETSRTIAEGLGRLVEFGREHGDTLKVLAGVFVGFRIGQAAVAGVTALTAALGSLTPVLAGIGRVAVAAAGQIAPLIGNLQIIHTMIIGPLAQAMAAGARSILTYSSGLTALLRIGNLWTAMLSLRFLPLMGALATTFTTFAGPILTAVIAALGGPILAALAGVTAAVVVVALAWSNNWGDIQGKAEAVGNFLNEQVLPLIGQFKDGVVGLVTGIRDDVTTIVDGLKVVWDTVATPWADALARLSDVVKTWSEENDGQLFRSGQSFINSFIEGLKVGLAPFSVVPFLQGVIGDKMLEFWDQLDESTKDKVTTLIKNIPLTVAKAVTGITVLESLAKITEQFKTWLTELDDVMKSRLGDILKGAFAFGFGPLAPLVYRLLKEVYGSGIIGDWLDRLGRDMPSRVAEIVGATSERFEGLVTGVEGTADRVGRVTHGIGQGLADVGRQGQGAGVRVGGYTVPPVYTLPPGGVMGNIPTGYVAAAHAATRGIGERGTLNDPRNYYGTPRELSLDARDADLSRGFERSYSETDRRLAVNAFDDAVNNALARLVPAGRGVLDQATAFHPGDTLHLSTLLQQRDAALGATGRSNAITRPEDFAAMLTRPLFSVEDFGAMEHDPAYQARGMALARYEATNYANAAIAAGRAKGSDRISFELPDGMGTGERIFANLGGAEGQAGAGAGNPLTAAQNRGDRQNDLMQQVTQTAAAERDHAAPLRSTSRGLIPGAPGGLPGYNVPEGGTGVTGGAGTTASTGTTQVNNFDEINVYDANPSFIRRFVGSAHSALGSL